MSKEQKQTTSTEQVRSELQRLYSRDKELKPSAVVEAAKVKGSPLHGCFEWDNGKAAHEFRLQQARKLIRVTVTLIDGGSARDPYVHVPSESATQEGAYHPLSVVVENTDWFARAYAEAATKLKAAAESLQELKRAAESSETPDRERMAKIALAISAMQAANAAVQALH